NFPPLLACSFVHARPSFTVDWLRRARNWSRFEYRTKFWTSRSELATRARDDPRGPRRAQRSVRRHHPAARARQLLAEPRDASEAVYGARLDAQHPVRELRARCPQRV